MGGCFRAIRHTLGLPLSYGVDDQDFQLLTRREIELVASVGWGTMIVSALGFLRNGLFR